tara:strand:+ start:706 stop:1233 length:528 start_codon:yes stop_codon:yes gene_type:complete
MIDGFEICETASGDMASIEKLYPDAFPEEDLLSLVNELLGEGSIVLSLAGSVDRTLVGHVIFTPCSVPGRTEEVSLLAPLAVSPAWQRRGIGSALVREGLRRLKNAGVVRVYVLGDPAYYGRLGFEPEADVMRPYPLPDEWQGAWQSIGLCQIEHPLHGRLSVPQPWQQPVLWAP